MKEDDLIELAENNNDIGNIKRSYFIIGLVVGIIIMLLLNDGPSFNEYFDGGYRQIWR